MCQGINFHWKCEKDKHNRKTSSTHEYFDHNKMLKMSENATLNWITWNILSHDIRTCKMLDKRKQYHKLSEMKAMMIFFSALKLASFDLCYWFRWVCLNISINVLRSKYSKITRQIQNLWHVELEYLKKTKYYFFFWVVRMLNGANWPIEC